MAIGVPNCALGVIGPSLSALAAFDLPPGVLYCDRESRVVLCVPVLVRESSRLCCFGTGVCFVSGGLCFVAFSADESTAGVCRALADLLRRERARAEANGPRRGVPRTATERFLLIVEFELELASVE